MILHRRISASEVSPAEVRDGGSKEDHGKLSPSSPSHGDSGMPPTTPTTTLRMNHFSSEIDDDPNTTVVMDMSIDEIDKPPPESPPRRHHHLQGQGDLRL